MNTVFKAAIEWVARQPKEREWTARDLSDEAGINLWSARLAVKAMAVNDVILCLGGGAPHGRIYVRVLDEAPATDTPNGALWTEREDGLLLEMLAEGRDQASMAKALGRTLYATRSRVTHLRAETGKGGGAAGRDLFAKAMEKAEARFTDVDAGILRREVPRLKAARPAGRWSAGCAALMCAEAI